MPPQDDDRSSLERARERLYKPGASQEPMRDALAPVGARNLPHEWDPDPLKRVPPKGAKHVRYAAIFFAGAAAFFVIAAGISVYLFYFGGNSVSVNKVKVELQGPTTVAGGDTVPLSLTITNENPVALDNATIEIDFPDGTRSADDITKSYPRYTENLGTVASGATVTRSVKAVVFGGAGDTLALPVSLSYGAAGSNAVFVKKSTYSLAISSTPLSVSVDTLAQAVSGQPLTITLNVRSNATVPIQNVVLAANLPFGFSPTFSSVLLTNSSFLLGTFSPGESKTVTLVGTLTAPENEQRVFHFTLGTANSASDPNVAVSYMSQDASVTLASPFIATSIAIDGNTAATPVLTPGATHSVMITYQNTLDTNVANAAIAVTISGSGVDLSKVNTTNGFYDSTTHTVRFSKDTDPSFLSLAPGAKGTGAFSFSTLPAGSSGSAPSVTITVSVSGTRTGESGVPEAVTASDSRTAKVSTVVDFSAASLHYAGPFANSGPIPPVAGQATTYTVVWNAKDRGSPVAGGTVIATLPSYVTYTGKTSGTGSISYDPSSRTVTWTVGDFAPGASAQGAFQVSLLPSTSQQTDEPQLTSGASFSGYDRFAGVQVTADAPPVTTETPGDPGYV
ncbi:MAG TPA: hypothetical protein VMT80_00400, partial [Candidatus Paceibacterota bacterium]|nr:hypothetical protein [Candidatus Paceibacterota bacterium]